jgi:Predicted dehydrogenases and related proteins
MEPDKEKNEKGKAKESVSTGRRDAIKTLATVPVLGAMAYGVYKKSMQARNNKLAAGLFRFGEDPSPVTPIPSDSRVVRLGIIGYGIRGSSLMRSLGFYTPRMVEDLKEQAKKDSKDTKYKDMKEQQDLRVVIAGVCDIFDVYANDAMDAGSNIYREGLNGKYGPRPKRFLNYKELMASPDVDAVIIAAPDHWHGTMVMEAARAGKHVYVEKPMTWTVPETYAVREAIRKSKIVFQLGHQNRQIDTNKRAREIVRNGMLGPITLVETSTNRNDPNGAWVYPINPGANPKTIDWAQFEGDPDRIKEYLDYMTSAGLARYVGPDPRDKFSLERFFRWRCWWDYSTGLSGDLLTHEYDALNQILDLGIPDSATSSGGVYFFRDGRTVPDVLQTVFEYRERKMSLLYSATLASQYNRPRKIMGHDATMEVGNSISITVDPQSEKYKDQIEKGIIKPDDPFYRYVPGKEVDAITSATEVYFAQRGLLYSYVDGKRFDTTFLHLKEWIECIRNGGETSCGIEQGFQEAMAAHMGTRAYLEGRSMYWDADNEHIVRG